MIATRHGYQFPQPKEQPSLRLEALDLASFDDWCAQVERGDESVVGPSLLFVPMARIEKLVLDRPSGNLPSMGQRFEARTGRSLTQVLG